MWIEIVSRNAIFKVEHHGGRTLFLKYYYLTTELHFIRFKAVTTVLLNVPSLWDGKLCV